MRSDRNEQPSHGGGGTGLPLSGHLQQHYQHRHNPGHKPAPLLTHEEFYGKWDPAENVIRLSTDSGKLVAKLKIIAPFDAKQVSLNDKNIYFVKERDFVRLEQKL